jgi:hypothetical protein
VINGSSDQRSSLREVSVTFDSIVDIEFSSGNPFRFTRNGAVEAINSTWSVFEVNGKTVVVFAFVAGQYVTASGSLVDGEFQLAIDATKISSQGLLLDGNRDGSVGGDFIFGAEQADRFYRKYGDYNGNGIVDLLDFAAFRRGFGSNEASAYWNEAFDVDGDKVIGLLDFAALRRNFGT